MEGIKKTGGAGQRKRKLKPEEQILLGSDDNDESRDQVNKLKTAKKSNDGSASQISSNKRLKLTA